MGLREIEHGSLIPLVFLATGGMAPGVTIMYKRLASLLADRRQQKYSKIISWICCIINFSLVRSAVMCLRGTRSSLHHPIRSIEEAPLDIAIHEAHIEQP